MSSHKFAVAAYVALGIVWGTNFLFMHLASPFISAGQTTLLLVIFGLLPVAVFALARRSSAGGICGTCTTSW